MWYREKSMIRLHFFKPKNTLNWNTCQKINRIRWLCRYNWLFEFLNKKGHNLPWCCSILKKTKRFWWYWWRAWPSEILKKPCSETLFPANEIVDEQKKSKSRERENRVHTHKNPHIIITLSTYEWKKYNVTHWWYQSPTVKLEKTMYFAIWNNTKRQLSDVWIIIIIIIIIV